MSGANYSAGRRPGTADNGIQFDYTYEKPDEQGKDDTDVPDELEEGEQLSIQDIDSHYVESVRILADQEATGPINDLLESSDVFREFVEAEVPRSGATVHSHKDIQLEDEDSGAQAVSEARPAQHPGTMNKHESHPSTKSFKEFAGLSAVVCVLFGALFAYFAYAGALGTVPVAIAVALLAISFVGFGRLWYEL